MKQRVVMEEKCQAGCMFDSKRHLQCSFHAAGRLRVKVEIRPLFFLRLPSTSDAAETKGMQGSRFQEASARAVHTI